MDYRPQIRRVISELNRRRINLHAVVVSVDGKIIYEEYRAPFTADTPHRMYSVTKSFVSAGIGCLIREGRLRLEDRVSDYFPDKLPDDMPEELRGQTVREMLIMNTALVGVNWFLPGVTDRTACYFSQKDVHPAGALFSYDSTGSYVLGALIERLSGMKLTEYLKSRFLNELGGFENAQILQTADGVAWGDSALVCTPRALERFARLVMNEGVFNGRQLIDREYLRQATSFQTDTALSGIDTYDTYGYGYQFWMTAHGGFALLGMGGQHAIVLPDKKLIFVMCGDNQYNPHYGDIVHDALFRELYPEEECPSPKGLPTASGRPHSDFAARIDGARFALKPNRMGWKWFRLCFAADEGTLEYENAQGVKRLSFGLGENRFVKFPQRGYSDGRGNVHDETSDFLYDCACSAAWKEERKLFIRVQIIDRYFGNLHMNFGFRDENACALQFNKVAEDFLNEYHGWAAGYRA